MAPRGAKANQKLTFKPRIMSGIKMDVTKIELSEKESEIRHEKEAEK
jgi:hypothetical protein